MRKTVVLLASLMLLIPFLPAGAAAAEGPSPPNVRATGYELIDATTGQVLLAHNPNLRLAPASTTKIMTALLTIEQGNLDRVVHVSPSAYGVAGSTVYLVPGQRLTIRDLLYGLLLVSGNDAAVELALADAGSVPKFVAEMNAKAKALGATHTTFLNPDGLYLPQHRTTAHDLALIARAALALPEFRKIDETRSYLFPGYPKPFTIYNQNKLLWEYPGALGMKIGYTIQADETIVGAAQRNGVTLIAVVLHTDYWHLWSDPQNLLNWGFRNFRLQNVLSAGRSLGRARDGVHAVLTSGYSWLAGPGQPTPQVRTAMYWPATWRKGQPVGLARVYVGGRQLDAVPLVAAAAAPMPKAGSSGGVLRTGVLIALGVLTISVVRGRVRRRRRRVRYRFKLAPKKSRF